MVEDSIEGDSKDESVSTKPIPGARGVFGATVGRVEGSVLRRQDRERTPVNKIMVPRAILGIISYPQKWRWWQDIRAGHGLRKAAKPDENR